MISVNERVAALRRKMKKNGVQACIIPSSDPHMKEIENRAPSEQEKKSNGDR